MKKEQLLIQLYQEEQRPAVIFDSGLRVMGMNRACIQRFPSMIEQANLGDFFPGLALEELAAGQPAPSRILQDPEGRGQMTVTAYPGEPCLYAGVWQDGTSFCPGKDGIGPEGVQLMDAWIRQNVFRIFNNLDQLGEYLERANVPQGEENLGRIERHCQQLLRLGLVLSGCYGPEESGVPAPVDMEQLLEQLFRDVDFRLAPLGIFLERKGHCRGAVCMLDRRQFVSALLCLIDLSAGQMEKGGVMQVELAKNQREFQLNFSDSATSFSAVARQNGEISAEEGTISENGGFSRLAAAFLERVVRESGGQCMMADGKPGIRVTLRLPLTFSEQPPAVFDQPAYTVRYRRQARSSLVSIILSDLPR